VVEGVPQTIFVKANYSMEVRGGCEISMCCEISRCCGAGCVRAEEGHGTLPTWPALHNHQCWPKVTSAPLGTAALAW
jgi:hypothetical protein